MRRGEATFGSILVGVACGVRSCGREPALEPWDGYDDRGAP